MWLRLRGRGAVREIGGGKMRGSRTSGMWKCGLQLPQMWRLTQVFAAVNEWQWVVRGKIRQAFLPSAFLLSAFLLSAFTAFITMRFAGAGLCAASTTDVFRTPRAFRFQLS